jgi:hypothetical protein
LATSWLALRCSSAVHPKEAISVAQRPMCFTRAGRNMVSR